MKQIVAVMADREFEAVTRHSQIGTYYIPGLPHRDIVAVLPVLGPMEGHSVDTKLCDASWVK